MKRFGVSVALACAATASAPQIPLSHLVSSSATPAELIRAAARKHHVPAALLKSIVAVESGFRSNAVSPSGALGLMQVMPATADAYGLDPSDPRENVEAGAKYLREMMSRYARHPDHLHRATAAYHVGPGAVDRWDGVPPYPHTQDFVARVMVFYRKYQREGI